MVCSLIIIRVLVCVTMIVEYIIINRFFEVDILKN